MTKQHSTTSHTHKSTLCQTRHLKVRAAYPSYQSEPAKPVGEIQLKGHWLIEAGFEINTPVKVRVMEGCLVLTIVPQPSRLLKGFNQLKQNEQRVIQDILEEFLKLKKS